MLFENLSLFERRKVTDMNSVRNNITYSVTAGFYWCGTTEEFSFHLEELKNFFKSRDLGNRFVLGKWGGSSPEGSTSNRKLVALPWPAAVLSRTGVTPSTPRTLGERHFQGAHVIPGERECHRCSR